MINCIPRTLPVGRVLSRFGAFDSRAFTNHRTHSSEWANARRKSGVEAHQPLIGVGEMPSAVAGVGDHPVCLGPASLVCTLPVATGPNAEKRCVVPPRTVCCRRSGNAKRHDVARARMTSLEGPQTTPQPVGRRGAGLLENDRVVGSPSVASNDYIGPKQKSNRFVRQKDCYHEEDGEARNTRRSPDVSTATERKGRRRQVVCVNGKPWRACETRLAARDRAAKTSGQKISKNRLIPLDFGGHLSDNRGVKVGPQRLVLATTLPGVQGTRPHKSTQSQRPRAASLEQSGRGRFLVFQGDAQ